MQKCQIESEIVNFTSVDFKGKSANCPRAGNEKVMCKVAPGVKNGIGGFEEGTLKREV